MYDNELIKKHQDQIRKGILNQFGVTENDIAELEKAHTDGELHPNGKWVWDSKASNGKGDWRTKKKTDGGTAPAKPTKTTSEVGIKKRYNLNVDGTPADLTKKKVKDLKTYESLIELNISSIKKQMEDSFKKMKPEDLAKLKTALEYQEGMLSEITDELKEREKKVTTDMKVEKKENTNGAPKHTQTANLKTPEKKILSNLFSEKEHELDDALASVSRELINLKVDLAKTDSSENNKIDNLKSKINNREKQIAELTEELVNRKKIESEYKKNMPKDLDFYKRIEILKESKGKKIKFDGVEYKILQSPVDSQYGNSYDGETKVLRSDSYSGYLNSAVVATELYKQENA